MQIIQDENNIKDPHLYVEKILKYQDEIDSLLNQCFKNNEDFLIAANNAFGRFINEGQFSAMYIAQFTDKEMRVGLKGASDFEVNRRFNDIIRLFRHCAYRDYFIKMYTHELSSRLINRTSISWEYEESFIQKLKVECGANAVKNMTQMLKDMTISESTLAEFNQFKDNLKENRSSEP